MRDKTEICIIKDCINSAIMWKGFLIKSRDAVRAGFCEFHKDHPCPNVFNKKDCYGIYNKGLGLLTKGQKPKFITVGFRQPVK